MNKFDQELEVFIENIEQSHAHLLYVDEAASDLLIMIKEKLMAKGFLEQNIFEVLSVKNQIVKEKIKEIKTKFKYETGSEKTVYLICKAEEMNPHAYNALLKFLEEPQNEVIAILITENISAVPETIKSRCRLFVMNNLKNIANEQFDKILDLAAQNDYIVFKEKILSILGDGLEMNALIKYLLFKFANKELNDLLNKSYLNVNINLLIDELFNVLRKKGDKDE